MGEQGVQLSYTFAKAFGIVELPSESGNEIGVRDDAPREALLEARRALGRPLSRRALSNSDFDAAISAAYGDSGLERSAADAMDQHKSLSSLIDDIPRSEDLLDSNNDAPVIRLINGVLQEAIKLRASDIHIEPHENRLSVRFRIDGVLREVLSLSSNLAAILVSRIKVMARLDIAKKRIPQDGRFSSNLGAQALDVRVSTLPSRYGERVVLRLLSKEQALLSVENLGMTAAMSAAFTKALQNPNGIVLVSGPTGSGKTTTLYAGLTMLNDASRNILTVEDPIEYAIDGIGQTQVNNKVGMSFATGLRAILRQDPDVVMVGEIRDPETAEIAVQASLTGHLVLSTVHTNSAAAAITRLRDMGVEKFLLASTVTAIIAQRLVRRLCADCKTPYVPDQSELDFLGLSAGETFYKPDGCPKCHGIGYDGRVGLYEMIEMNDHLRELIHEGAREQDIANYAFENADTLLQSGVRHILNGTASAEDVLRVCRQSGDS